MKLKIAVTASYHSMNNPYEFTVEIAEDGTASLVGAISGTPTWARKVALAVATGEEYERPKGAGDHRRCKEFDPHTREGCLYAGRFDK